MPKGVEMAAVWEPFQEAAGLAWTGAKTVDQALDDAQKEIEELIAEME